MRYRGERFFPDSNDDPEYRRPARYNELLLKYAMKHRLPGKVLTHSEYDAYRRGYWVRLASRG